MTHTLPDLEYGYDALEPFIDAETMEIHHTKHHQTYINKLNDALTGDTTDLQELLIGNDSPAVQNNGGGHFNHSFFWKILAPASSGSELSEDLKNALIKTFGSFDSFKEEFKKAALARFGSGWVWLSINKKTHALEIFSKPNQDHPNLATHIPLLGLDVWEHAYYLKYQNKRPDYVDAFFKVVNWSRVSEIYSQTLSSSGNGN